MFIFYAALFVILNFSSTGDCEVQYGNYINSSYNYEIIIPLSWLKEELTLSNKQFMYASMDANTQIKVRVFKSSNENIENTVHSEIWDLRKIDPGLCKIIETEKITIKKNISGKLLIFEYRSQKNNFLQRTLITVNNKIIYIIECRSPLKTFYKYEDIFTTALASFKFIQGGPELNLSEKKEDAKREVKKDEDGQENSLEEDENL